MAVSHESALDVDDSEEWQDVDVSEEWGTPITPSMATTTCCDVIEPHKEFVVKAILELQKAKRILENGG